MIFPRLLIALWIVITVQYARAVSEIAVAIRYLLPIGVSHAQLFLYRGDGKLLRQLTDDNTAQVMNPVFAPDGASIVFTRELAAARKEYWSVEPKGAKPHKLDAAPDWYLKTKSSPSFTDIDSEPQSSPTPNASPIRWAPGQPFGPPGPDHVATPDGAQELIFKVSGEPDTLDQPGRGKHYELRDVKAGTEIELGDLPGFLGLFELLHLDSAPATKFLITPGLRLAFFNLHLSSTEADTVFALDLSKPRFVRLSDNWARPFPLPGEPAFLTFTEARYVPIPGTRKTANCSYIDHWDASLNRIRYSRDTAAICYGASMYRPDNSPSSVNFIHKEQEE